MSCYPGITDKTVALHNTEIGALNGDLGSGATAGWDREVIVGAVATLIGLLEPPLLQPQANAHINAIIISVTLSMIVIISMFWQSVNASSSLLYRSGVAKMQNCNYIQANCS